MTRYPSTFSIVFTFGGFHQDVSFATTLGAAKREADDLITRDDVDYAAVYDRDDREVYQAFAA